MNYGTILSIMPVIFVYCSSQYLPRLIDRKDRQSSDSVIVSNANTVNAPESDVDKNPVNPAVVRMHKWGIMPDINHDNFARKIDIHTSNTPPTVPAEFKNRTTPTIGLNNINENTVPEMIVHADPTINDIGRDIFTKANTLNFNDYWMQASNDLLRPGFQSLKIIENNNRNRIAADNYFRNRILGTDIDLVNMRNSYSHSIDQHGINVGVDSAVADHHGIGYSTYFDTIQNNINRNIILSSTDQASSDGHNGGGTLLSQNSKYLERKLDVNDAHNVNFRDRIEVHPARSVPMAESINPLQLSVSDHVNIPPKSLNTAQPVFRASDTMYDAHAVNDHHSSAFLNPTDSYYNKAHQAGNVQRDMITVEFDT